MKTGLHSVIYAVVSNGAIALCFLPFLILGRKEIRKLAACWVLGIYWFLNGADNFLEVFCSSATGNPIVRRFSLYYSLCEAPLLLLVFALAKRGRQRKALLLVMAVYIVGESMLVRESGRAHLLLILGSGLALVILGSLMGLWEYVKKMEHSGFENSMAFVYAAILFYYGSSLIIYVFAHLHRLAGANVSDSYLLYYISLLLSAAVTCIGLWWYRAPGPRGPAWSPPPGYSSSSS